MQTIIPHLFLCPTTSVFLLSLITFSLSIYTLNALHSHTSDINLTPRAYAGLVGFTLFHIDWRNILLSLQIFMPIYIWGATVIGVLLTLGLNGVMRMCFRGRFGRYKEANVEQNGGGEQGEDSAEIEKR
jgi:hypothetical protein